MNVRLRESENQVKFAELFFNPEKLQVVGIDRGKLVGSVLQGEGKDTDFGAFDILRKIGIGTFHLHPRLFPRNYPGRIFNPVKNAVMNPLHDIIDGNRSAGILKTTAAMIAGCGGEQCPVRGQDIEAQQSQLLDNRNKGMKGLLVQGFSNSSAEVGESSLAGDPTFPKSCQTPIVASTIGIPKDKAEILDRSNPFEITKQVEQKQRNGIIARPSENGIGLGGNGADEGEIDNGSYQLRDAATNGTLVINMNEFLSKLIMRKPASPFFGKWFAVTAIDEGIDFPELSDNISNREAGGFAHLKAPGVSREKLPPSKILPGNPFLFVNARHQTSLTHPIQTNASGSSVSTNTGGTAFRSLSCV